MPLRGTCCLIWKAELHKTASSIVRDNSPIKIFWFYDKGWTGGVWRALNTLFNLQFCLRLVWVKLCHFSNVASHAPCLPATKLQERQNECKRKSSFKNTYRLLLTCIRKKTRMQFPFTHSFNKYLLLSIMCQIMTQVANDMIIQWLTKWGLGTMKSLRNF